MTNIEWETELREGCKWWANVLRDGAKHDAGDAGINAMAAWAQEGQKSLPESQLAAFEEALFKRMTEHWMQYNRVESFAEGTGSVHWVIATDYSPCRPMGQAAHDAGIFPDSGAGDSITRFPCKTIMWLEPGKVTVRYGYAAPIETIWEAEVVRQEGVSANRDIKKS